MRHVLKLATAAIVGLALFASLALAQGGEGQKVYNWSGQRTLVVNRADSTQHVTSGDASGNASVVEQYPIPDMTISQANIIYNAALIVGAADSSAVLDVHRMRHGMLLFKITPSVGAGRINRIAVQVRAHLGGGNDSLTTFAFYPYGQSDQGAQATIASQTDTTTVGHLITGSASAPYSGEFTIVANGVRNSTGAAGAGQAYAYPNGIAIPIESLFGRTFWAPYMSVRVRNLVGPTCAITVHLVGSAL